MKRAFFEEELKKIVSRLKEIYKPEKIILFGSLARGEENPNDVDLLLVKDKVPFLGVDRIREVSALFEHRIAVDTFVYTPSEFDSLSKFDPFLKLILKEGKVLYG